MKTIMCCLAVLVAITVFASAAFAQEPTLSSVEAKFDTTKDGKNDNSKLDIYLKNSDGQEVGKSEGNEGHWDKKTSHTVSIKIEGNPTKAALANGSVLLTFHPHGADNWRFDYQITLSFSDGSFIIKELEGCELTQYNTSRTDTF